MASESTRHGAAAPLHHLYPAAPRQAPAAAAGSTVRLLRKQPLVLQLAGHVEPVQLQRTQPAAASRGTPLYGFPSGVPCPRPRPDLSSVSAAPAIRVHAALEPCTIGGDAGNPQQRTGAQGVAGPGRAEELQQAV